MCRLIWRGKALFSFYFFFLSLQWFCVCFHLAQSSHWVTHLVIVLLPLWGGDRPHSVPWLVALRLGPLCHLAGRLGGPVTLKSSLPLSLLLISPAYRCVHVLPLLPGDDYLVFELSLVLLNFSFCIFSVASVCLVQRCCMECEFMEPP